MKIKANRSRTGGSQLRVETEERDAKKCGVIQPIMAKPIPTMKDVWMGQVIV
jgi:hypothetical protein